VALTARSCTSYDTRVFKIIKKFFGSVRHFSKVGMPTRVDDIGRGVEMRFFLWLGVFGIADLRIVFHRDHFWGDPDSGNWD
jgi:hypothetical protein